MINVIKFSTPWCGPCRMYAPIFDKLKSQFPNVSFQSIDADQNPELAKRYGIRGVPATIIEKNGVEVRRLMGAQSEAQLVSIIKSV